MSTMFNIIKNLYKARKITYADVWSYVGAEPPKITAAEAILICGPRKE